MFKLLNFYKKQDNPEALLPYERLLKMVGGKGSSDTQNIIFDTIKAKLYGGKQWEQTKSLFRYNGYLYDQRACKCAALQILRFGRKHAYLPVSQRLGGKMSFADFLMIDDATKCPSLSSISKRIYAMR